MKYKKINYYLLYMLSPTYARALNRSAKNEIKTKDELHINQLSKLKNLIRHAKTNVPYYNKLLNDINVTSMSDLTKIPFLTKEIIRAQKENLKAGNLPLCRFKPNSTSGSTGATMKFFSDNKTDVVRHACANRGDSWTGWRFGEPIVLLWGASKDTNKAHTLKSKLVNSGLLFNTRVLSSYNMTNDDMTKYLHLINRVRPSLIVGYPSSLELLSKHKIELGIKVFSPKGIITGGETLHEYQKDIIQDAFAANVLNRYGCREVGHISNECEKQNGLHISTDHVIIEVVNSNGKLCKPGEAGEIVVTDLDNYVYPFIRYKIGDIGILSERKCTCGRAFPMLEKIMGRTFDVVLGKNGNRVLATYFTLSFRYSVRGIEQFQLVQASNYDIKINVKSNEQFTKDEEIKTINLVKEKLGNDMQIIIHQVDEIEPTESGKFRWVISELSHHA